MNQPVLDFTRKWVERLGVAGLDTLEMGSYDENGSVRRFFTGRYVGTDLRAGPGVDVPCVSWDLHQLYPAGSFDTVVSTEMLEHDAKFWLTFQRAHYLLKPGGHFIVTARGIGFPHHDFPHDYYRFTEDAFRFLFDWAGFEALEVLPCPEQGVLGIGRKR